MNFVHAAVLGLVDLAGVFVGFVVHQRVRARNQVAVQVPVGIVAIILAFLAWLWLVRRSRLSWSRRSPRAELAVFLLAFVCAAVVFVPMHYVSEGYVTAAGNVAALWAFQLVANSIALLVARRVFPTSP